MTRHMRAWHLVCARGIWIAIQIEDVNGALPHDFAVEGFFDRHSFNKGSRATVLGFDGFREGPKIVFRYH